MAFFDFKRILAHQGNANITESEKAELLIDPWLEQPKYARVVVYFLCGGMLLFCFGNMLARFRRTKNGARLASTTPSRRAVAAARYLASSQPRAVGSIRFPTVGVILPITAFWIFIGIWALAQQPYYRSRWNLGSPPLALRTGLLARGCFPFIFALSTKRSLVTFITGYSHEKLQVFHQWLSHVFRTSISLTRTSTSSDFGRTVILSILHTIPFIIQGNREIRSNTDGLNPDGHSQLYYSWFVSREIYYWSGFASLVPFAWLCWGSYAPLRNRFYEMFKLLHATSAIVYSAFLCIHYNNVFATWAYFWATLAIYGSSIITRFLLIVYRNARSCPRGTLTALPCGAVRLTVPIPTSDRWTAGQHFFLHLIIAVPLEWHPYTISNAPYIDPDSKEPNRTMVFLLRVNPKSGLGPKLLGVAKRGKLTPVIIDGPYGGLGNVQLGRHETVLLLAGGAGASFITALLEGLCEEIRRNALGVVTKKVELLWAVREEAAKEWFEKQIVSSVALVPGRTVSVHLFVTGAAEENLPKEDGSDPANARSWPTTHDRPDLTSIVTSALATVPAGTSVGIGSCGPTSFTLEVRNTVAAWQKLIMLGKTGGVGAEEVELFTEEFDW